MMRRLRPCSVVLALLPLGGCAGSLGPEAGDDGGLLVGRSTDPSHADGGNGDADGSVARPPHPAPDGAPIEPDAAAPRDDGAAVDLSADAAAPRDGGAAVDLSADAPAPPTEPPTAPPTEPPADACAGEPCGPHGWCVDGVCLCDPGYAGQACNACDGAWVPLDGAVPPICAPSTLLDGTVDDDALDGAEGDEHVRGLDGNDAVRGMDGQDLVNGNRGNDVVNGNRGRDEVHGGADDDEVYGGGDDDVVFGDDGNDVVSGDLGNDRLIGGAGDDTLLGGEGDDRYVIDGLGDDVIDDIAGTDAARCLTGVAAVRDQVVGADRVLVLSTGGTVRILGDRVESVLGCR